MLYRLAFELEKAYTSPLAHDTTEYRLKQTPRRKIVNTIWKTTQVLSGGDNIEPLPPINRIPALLLVHVDSHDTAMEESVSQCFGLIPS
jgi:hypothetical protein